MRPRSFAWAVLVALAPLSAACVLPDYHQTGTGQGGSGGGGGGSSPACDEPLTKSIGTPNTDEFAVDVVVDGTDAYVLGGFNGTIGYVPGTTLTAIDWDVFVAKLGADGAAEWVAQLPGVDSQFGASITQTSDGGLVVVGIFRGELGTVSPPVASAGEYDIFAVRLEPDGTVGWTVTFGGPNDDRVTDVAATADGGVVMVGYFTDEILIDGETLPGGVPDTMSETFVVKLDAAGGFVTKKAFTEAGASSSSSLAILPDGSSYMAGSYSGRLGFVAPETAPDADATDAFVVKFDEDLNPLWSRRYGGAGDQVATNLVPAGDGFAIAGITTGDPAPIDFGGTTATATDKTPGLFVARVSDANVGAWARIVSTAEADVSPEPVVSALAVAGDQILVGLTVKHPLTVGAESLPATTDASDDPVLLTLDGATGTFTARAGLSAPEDQRIEEIVAGTCGVVFVGWFYGSLTMPGTPKVETTGRNVAVGRLAASVLGE